MNRLCDFRKVSRQHLLFSRKTVGRRLPDRHRALIEIGVNFLWRERSLLGNMMGRARAAFHLSSVYLFSRLKHSLDTVSQTVNSSEPLGTLGKFLKRALDACQCGFQRDTGFLPRFDERPVQSGEKCGRAATPAKTLLDFREVVEVVFQRAFKG